MNIKALINNNNLMLRSMLWQLSSYMAFATINLIVKYLSGNSSIYIENPLPVFTIVFFQHLIASILILPIIFQKKEQLFYNPNSKLYNLRALAAVLGVGFWYSTLKFFPVSKSVALNFVGPIMTMLGAILFLKEKISIYKIGAISLSFTGAFVILKDSSKGTSSFDWFLLFPLIAAIGFSISKLTTKKLTSLGEESSNLTYHLILYMVPISFVFALIEFQLPSFFQIKYLVLMALLALYAQYSFTKAYSMSDIIFLLPLSFLNLIINIMSSYFIFSEANTNQGFWLGLCFILSSLFLLTLESQKTKS